MTVYKMTKHWFNNAVSRFKKSDLATECCLLDAFYLDRGEVQTRDMLAMWLDEAGHGVGPTGGATEGRRSVMDMQIEQEDDSDIDLDDPCDHNGDSEWAARMANVHKQDGDPPCCGRCGECFK